MNLLKLYLRKCFSILLACQCVKFCDWCCQGNLHFIAMYSNVLHLCSLLNHFSKCFSLYNKYTIDNIWYFDLWKLYLWNVFLFCLHVPLSETCDWCCQGNLHMQHIYINVLCLCLHVLCCVILCNEAFLFCTLIYILVSVWCKPI